MNLEKYLIDVLHHLGTNPKRVISKEEIIAVVDMTLLNEQASPETLQEFFKKAQSLPIAAICLLPKHLSSIPNTLTAKRATVINFPDGKTECSQLVAELSTLLMHNHIDEIDFVFPYRTYLQQNKQTALDCTASCYELCKQQQITFKVILETGAFTSPELIYQASLDIIATGCDFLKSSTGKIPQGVTIPDAFAMLMAIHHAKSTTGIKLSGGITTEQQAQTYIYLAEYLLEKPITSSWFRIGASSLIDELVGSTRHTARSQAT